MSDDTGPVWIEPDIPGPVAARFGRLRRTLTAFAKDSRLELCAYESADFEFEIWCWNMYGRGLNGDFCIQAQCSPADDALGRVTFALYRWMPDGEAPTFGSWAPSASWTVDDDARLSTTLKMIRRDADEPVVEPDPEDPKRRHLKAV